MKKFNRDFKIWAYTVSHGFLILRSPMKFDDQAGCSEDNNFNIDIEFSSVAYLDLPCNISGIEINEIQKNIPEKLLDLKIKFQFKVFEILSSEKVYYIVAGNYIIGKNKWISEDRISDMNLEYEEILETSI